MHVFGASATTPGTRGENGKLSMYLFIGASLSEPHSSEYYSDIDRARVKPHTL